jgi:hypothetical protein
MLRKIRIAILLFTLATVAVAGWKADKAATDWNDSLHVTLYPIVADDSEATRQHLAKLDKDAFQDFSLWLEDELRRYGHHLRRPVSIQLAPPMNERPPEFPASQSAWSNIGWSLQLRYWAWRHDAAPGPRPDVRLFLLYHDPRLSPELDHSVGLEKGKLGLIKLFASPDETRRNQVIVAHEFLHTLGATDKYASTSLHPRFPDGYAEPALEPRYPQRFAEIMGGRRPLNDAQSRIPDSLDETLIGDLTAQEVGLKKRR